MVVILHIFNKYVFACKREEKLKRREREGKEKGKREEE